MNIVSVKHRNGGEKEYWFEVPEEIVSQVKPGNLAVCDTIRGREFAIVASNVISGENVDQMAVRLGARLPLRKIIKTTELMSMSNIKIPRMLAVTRPRPEKIAKRMHEFYDHKAFDTDVVVDKNGNLLDGYTAYLVAKMFDMKYLDVRVATL